MSDVIPWYRSTIFVGALVSVISQLLAAFDLADVLPSEHLAGIVDASLQALAIAAAAYTAWRRTKQDSGLALTKESAKEKSLPVESGIARVSLLAALAVAIAGCAGTMAAYKSADSLRDRAYVLNEHYAALIHEAADLSEKPSTPQAAKDAIKAAANASAKYIVGDPASDPPLPSLLDLVKSWEATSSAESEAALQMALANATREIAALIKALRSAQLSSASVSGEQRSDLILSWAGVET